MGKDSRKTPGKPFRKRKVSALHLFYVIVIFVIVQLFLLVICPGRINEYAFDNFSFASTVVSIVLAVISIVYTFQSGQSSSDQLSNIKDIEGRIHQEINRFSDIDERITRALKPIGDSIGDIRQQTSDINKSIKDNLLFATPPSDTNDNASTATVDICTLPRMFRIVFYISQRCVDTGKPFPFFILKNVAEKHAYYCLGVINCLSAFRPELMTIVRGAEYTQITITRFDAGALGITSLDALKDSLSALLEREKYKNLFKELDMYFQGEGMAV